MAKRAYNVQQQQSARARARERGSMRSSSSSEVELAQVKEEIRSANWEVAAQCACEPQCAGRKVRKKKKRRACTAAAIIAKAAGRQVAVGEYPSAKRCANWKRAQVRTQERTILSAKTEVNNWEWFR